MFVRRTPSVRRQRGKRQEPMAALRVLVVEDERLLGIVLADVLEELGYVVCAVEMTEQNAIVAALWHRPDLIIIDAHLGVGSGVAAIDTILRRGFVPHVFVSGDVASIRARRQGAIAIQKPFRVPDLIAAIDRAFGVDPVLA
jgi:CheY-like chemotaxis protein